LAVAGIDWHWLRYHKSPSLPATSYDVLAGIRYGSRLVRDKQIEMVHARSYIPAAIALRLKRRFGVKMIFDVRGLMADEYFDAGHWRKESTPYRITKAMECRALAALWPDKARFRSHVIMQRHGYGQGEYQYFTYPLPEAVERLRQALYPELAAVANGWNEALGLKRRFPPRPLAGMTPGAYWAPPKEYEETMASYNEVHRPAAKRRSN